MIHGDAQLGGPSVLFVGTKAAIEALAGVATGAHAYATDAGPGWYNGTTWDWGAGGGAVTPHGPTHEYGDSDEICVTGLSGVLVEEQNAGKIKGKVVSLTGLENGKALIYDLSSDTFKPGDAAGGSDPDALHKSGINEFASLPRAYTQGVDDALLMEKGGGKYQVTMSDLEAYFNARYNRHNHNHDPNGIGQGAPIPHGYLYNLLGDDHPQYINADRGDDRYSQLSHSHEHDNLVGTDMLNEYQHLSVSEKMGLTWGGTTELHTHDSYVPVPATDLFDSGGIVWGGGAKAVGTYTFRPQDNGNLWPADAKALQVQLMAGWTAASNASTCSLRRSSTGVNEIQVRAQVANINALCNGNIALDENGYFYAAVAGATGGCLLRILGYYR